MNLFHITYPRDAKGFRDESRFCSASLIEGCSNGFVFSPFGIDTPIYTIPFDLHYFTEEELHRWCSENDRAARSYPYTTTPQAAHLELVADAVKFAGIMEQQSGAPAKVIAARVKVAHLTRKLSHIYRELVEAYPDACVFLFSTAVSGTWIGASPELLCRLSKESAWLLETSSLAGTRPAGTEGEWDEKNIREQAVVTQFLTAALMKLGMQPTTGATETLRAGQVEHLHTRISASFTQYSGEGSPIEKILRTLSPTPALCGYPREEALDFILSHESAPRDFYGGFFGTVTPVDASIYVNLRSGRLLPDGKGIALFAGGGITSESIPESEWEETERKLTTIMSHL